MNLTDSLPVGTLVRDTYDNILGIVIENDDEEDSSANMPEWMDKYPPYIKVAWNDGKVFWCPILDVEIISFSKK